MRLCMTGGVGKGQESGGRCEGRQKKGYVDGSHGALKYEGVKDSTTGDTDERTG